MMSGKPWSNSEFVSDLCGSWRTKLRAAAGSGYRTEKWTWGSQEDEGGNRLVVKLEGRVLAEGRSFICFLWGENFKKNGLRQF